MEIQLNEITAELAGNAGLATALNENFKPLANVIKARETVIITRLQKIESGISKIGTDVRNTQASIDALTAEVGTIRLDIAEILRRLGGEPEQDILLD